MGWSAGISSNSDRRLLQAASMSTMLFIATTALDHALILSLCALAVRCMANEERLDLRAGVLGS